MSEERVQLGIEGLDSMMGGGLLKDSICAIVGSYGTGKTTFALQYIFEGLKSGETCIYISLEEREEMIFATIRNKGWDFESYLNKTFYVIKLDPTDFNVSINSIKNELPALIEKTQASRIVIDPVSLFEGLFDDPATRRKEIFRFAELMRDMQCTFVLTSETDVGNVYSSKYGLIEYLADTVIILRYVRPHDMAEVHLTVEVVKMRRSNHSREIKPFEILADRVMVYSEASVF